MNATFFLISAACLAGADPVPATPAPAAPAIVASAPGCGGCAPTCDPCSHHISIFEKLKARLHCHKSSCCAPAPSCAPACAPKPAPCAPAPVACAPACAPAPCAPACKPHCSLHLPQIHLFHGCSTSACGCAPAKIGLFDRLRARFHHSTCDSCASPCSTGPAMVAPMTTTPPKVMPTPPKEEPKPKTTALAPITPLVDVGGTTGKY